MPPSSRPRLPFPRALRPPWWPTSACPCLHQCIGRRPAHLHRTLLPPRPLPPVGRTPPAFPQPAVSSTCRRHLPPGPLALPTHGPPHPSLPNHLQPRQHSRAGRQRRPQPRTGIHVERPPPIVPGLPTGSAAMLAGTIAPAPTHDQTDAEKCAATPKRTGDATPPRPSAPPYDRDHCEKPLADARDGTALEDLPFCWAGCQGHGLPPTCDSTIRPGCIAISALDMDMHHIMQAQRRTCACARTPAGSKPSLVRQSPHTL